MEERARLLHFLVTSEGVPFYLALERIASRDSFGDAEIEALIRAYRRREGV